MCIFIYISPFICRKKIVINYLINRNETCWLMSCRRTSVIKGIAPMGRHDKLCRHQWGTGKGLLWDMGWDFLWLKPEGHPRGPRTGSVRKSFLLVVNGDIAVNCLVFGDRQTLSDRQTNEQTNRQKTSPSCDRCLIKLNWTKLNFY